MSHQWQAPDSPSLFKFVSNLSFGKNRGKNDALIFSDFTGG